MDEFKRDQYKSVGFGLILVIISIILLGAKINPLLIVINIEIEAGWVDVNLTFLLWIIMFIIGIVIIIKGITPKSNLFENTPSFKIRKELDDYEYKSEKKKKVKISNFAWFQLVCSILLIIVAVIQYIEFGADFSFDNGNGNWIFLGGPSLFYATSFFPIFYAVGLMFYAIFSQKNIIFQETKDSYVICEKRFTLKNYTEIPKDKITAVFISNTKTGVRFLWIFPLGIHIWYLGIDAFAYLLNPMAFDRGLITGWYFMLQVVVNLIVLMILLLSPISYLEIHDNEKRYIIKFISIKKKGKNQSDIAKLVEYFNLKNENSGQIVQHQAKFTFKKLLRTQLIIGLIFITIAIISRVFNFYAGGILRLPLFLSGILLITKGIKKNFLHIKPPYSYWQVKEKKGLLDKRSFLCFNEIAWFPENERNQSNKVSHLDQIDFYDYIIIAILPTMMILNFLSIIILTPSTYSGFYYKILIFIIFSGIILYLLWKMYLRPEGFLKFSTAYENFFFSLNDGIQHSIKNPILRKKAIFRLSISLGCSILSSIFYIISVFF